MAKFACRVRGEKTSLVDAANLSFADRGVFYCSTPDCQATMHVRDVQKECACFVSDDISAHVDPLVCLKKDNFKSDQYDEKQFNLEECFLTMLKEVKISSSNEKPEHCLGGHNKIPIRTLKTLYEMCLQYRGKKYNGYDIDDILVDKYNYDRYSSGIEGYRIVSCTFYKFDPDPKIQTITMNYPFVGKARVKIHINDKKTFDVCVKKLKDSTHKNSVVIAGKWRLSNEEDILAECELCSVAKQTCKG